MTKRACKKVGCDWKKKKNICKAKFECVSLKRGRCKKVGGVKGCKWNKGEKVCQVKGPDQVDGRWYWKISMSTLSNIKIHMNTNIVIIIYST